MAISDRLTKLTTDITNAYTSISNKGGTIPSDKNTNNLATAINSIEVIEEATAEGEDLTLTNTKAMHIKSVKVKGKTEQESTTGANLQKFNARTDSSYGVSYSCNNKGQVITSGTATQATTFSYNMRTTNPISLTAGTYIIKVIGNISNNTKIILNNIQEITLDNNQEYIYILDSNLSDFYIGIRCGEGANVNNFYITLASGTTATTERYTARSKS